MNLTNDNTNQNKGKHLTFKERVLIQLRIKDKMSSYKIAKELQRPINTITNEVKRGTTTIIKGKNKIECYFAETGQAVYERNRLNSKKNFKLLKCSKFIDYVVKKFKNKNWSIDATVGEAIVSGKFHKEESVSTKTLYNYIDLGLLDIRAIDLPMKLRRRNKRSIIRKNKRVLGASIEERPEDIDTRNEFGHWEIDTVIGEKTADDKVLLTIVERKTRYSIVVPISGKDANSVNEAMAELQVYYGDGFKDVFKSITSDNGSEFSKLSELEKTGIKVYFTHPYSSYERGTNERQNGLIRRFIPKGKRISDYALEKGAVVEEWMNTLPRKILKYKTPEYLFESHLDEIYKI